ncbi:hypothetical protein F5X99DRAFT_413929 [Biscogniauxia marginata]|nr:hypothetical protein F5X99DRAFT_413929 [Biscogniauxia marginata]
MASVQLDESVSRVGIGPRSDVLARHGTAEHWLPASPACKLYSTVRRPRTTIRCLVACRVSNIIAIDRLAGWLSEESELARPAAPPPCRPASTSALSTSLTSHLYYRQGIPELDPSPYYDPPQIVLFPGLLVLATYANTHACQVVVGKGKFAANGDVIVAISSHHEFQNIARPRIGTMLCSMYTIAFSASVPVYQSIGTQKRRAKERSSLSLAPVFFGRQTLSACHPLKSDVDGLQTKPSRIDARRRYELTRLG